MLGTRIITCELLAWVCPHTKRRRNPLIWNEPILGHAVPVTFAVQLCDSVSCTGENLLLRDLVWVQTAIKAVGLVEAAQTWVALPVIQCILVITSEQFQIMAGHYWLTPKMILSTRRMPSSKVLTDLQSLCLSTSILSGWVMTVTWNGVVLPIQLCQKTWVLSGPFAFVNIFDDIKQATDCVLPLEKTLLLGSVFLGLLLYIDVCLFRDPLGNGPFSFQSPCFTRCSPSLFSLCRVLFDSSFLFQVILYQGGQIFGGAPQFYGRVGFAVTMPTTSASIFINNTQLSDTGTYQCLVNNLPDRGSRNIGVIGLTVLGVCIGIMGERGKIGAQESSVCDGSHSIKIWWCVHWSPCHEGWVGFWGQWVFVGHIASYAEVYKRVLKYGREKAFVAGLWCGVAKKHE